MTKNTWFTNEELIIAARGILALTRQTEDRARKGGYKINKDYLDKLFNLHDKIMETVEMDLEEKEEDSNA